MKELHMNRRALLRGAAGLALGAGAGAGASVAAATSGDWEALAASYDIAGDFINLENAYYGIMARPVAEAFKRNIDTLNTYNSQYLRTRFDRTDIETVRARLAAHAGVGVHELAHTRNATEALQILIGNNRRVGAGDTIIMGNLDYNIMQDAMNDLALRRGASVFTVQVPEPATRQNVIDAYARALERHPRARLLLLTHISHRTGLVLPVAEIVQIARARKVDVVVDAAQSYGQLDFKLPDFGADFVGVNLHKWIGAPLGTGFLYIREGRLGDIAIQAGNTEHPADDIRSRVHAGTINAAAVMTIPAALDFHARFTLAERSARLRRLRDRWVHQVRALPQVQVLTPDDPAMYGAVTSFRLRSQTGFEDNVALARRLAEEYGIFTVARNGPVGGSCIRVTPSYFTRDAELDKLADAIRVMAA